MLSTRARIETAQQRVSSPVNNNTQCSSGDAPSGFILKLFQMVNGAPDEVIAVSGQETSTTTHFCFSGKSNARQIYLYSPVWFINPQSIDNCLKTFPFLPHLHAAFRYHFSLTIRSQHFCSLKERKKKSCVTVSHSLPFDKMRSPPPEQNSASFCTILG